MTNPDLSVELAGLKLKNPVMTASGTFGFGECFTDFFPLAELGALVVKGVTLEPSRGNPGPRLYETPAGLLNSIGLENPGVDKVVAEYLPALETADVPVIVNISGNTIEEYCKVAAKLNDSTAVKGLEVNISCPNVKAGGILFGTKPEMSAQVVAAIRQHTSLPLIVKLSPNVTDIAEIALAVEEAGADAISLINTMLGMAIDVKKRKPVFANTMAGFSGPAVKPVALRMVWQVAQAVKIPVIGMGGIVSTEDALEFIMAGATAIAVGTGQLFNPRCCSDIIKGLEEYCHENKITKLSSLCGAAWASKGGCM